jgi:hypothetical protein
MKKDIVDCQKGEGWEYRWEAILFPNSTSAQSAYIV